VAERIGILGGTFNPIHIGHLAIAEMARETFKLKKVIFTPCYFPPHKNVRNFTPAHVRQHMVELAIQRNPQFEISDIEIKRGGKSFTVDTLEYFKRILPQGTKIYFIIGEDSFPFLKTWKNIDRILKLCTFIVVNRPGCQPFKSPIHHYAMTMPGLEISSKCLRQRVAQGKSIKYLVPDNVFQYINQRKLYR
jgi:nicotinate-nucleotide adenylyltransferase